MLTGEDEELIKNHGKRNESFLQLRDNKPCFKKEEIEKGLKNPFEKYFKLDGLKRCRGAFACITKKGKKPKHNNRIKPTAWKSIKCEAIKDGGYLYNKCHLIGRQLATKKANRKGLITGTRWLNIKGMSEYENRVANYITENSKHHILYRVTPYYKEKDDLLPYGVQMEILDIDDEENFSFNVFIFNKQPGFTISYKNGDVYSDYSLSLLGKKRDSNIYVIDLDTNMFHKETCESVCNIKNRKYFAGKEQTLEKEYCKCESCIS